MNSVAVWIAASVREPAYQVAVAGLPLSAHLANDPAGAVAVVGGSCWWKTAREALRAGAIGLVVEQPGRATAAELSELAGLAGSAPVIVDRGLLRADMVDQAVAGRDGAVPRVVTAEVRSPGTGIDCALRDALGWVRSLIGAVVVTAAAGPTTQVGALVGGGPDRLPGVISCTQAARGARFPELRVSALGETRTEIVVDPLGGIARVVTATSDGVLLAPPRHESAQRLALRRCLEAIREGGVPADLDDLRNDSLAAGDIVSRTTCV